MSSTLTIWFLTNLITFFLLLFFPTLPLKCIHLCLFPSLLLRRCYSFSFFPSYAHHASFPYHSSAFPLLHFPLPLYAHPLTSRALCPPLSILLAVLPHCENIFPLSLIYSCLASTGLWTQYTWSHPPRENIKYKVHENFFASSHYDHIPQERNGAAWHSLLHISCCVCFWVHSQFPPLFSFTFSRRTDGRKAAWHSFLMVQLSGRGASSWFMVPTLQSAASGARRLFPAPGLMVPH